MTPPFQLRNDGWPLRTKIVATIGDPQKYPDGIVDLDGRALDGDLDYDRLVAAFYRHGVDVIRLNLSHLGEPERARQVFRAIKDAILACEAGSSGLKRMAVLADLPGPKIRFRIDPEIALAVGDELTIVFDREASGGNEQAVYVDRLPLMAAMNKIDDIRDQLGYYRDDEGYEPPAGDVGGDPREAAPWDPEISENILGYPMEPARHRSRLFERMMHQIGDQIATKGQVLVFIGEAEVVLEVRPDAFDPRRAGLPCRVVNVRNPRITGKKGFSIKGIDINIPTFNKQDRSLLDALLDEDLSGDSGSDPVCAYVGLSFTQTADDVLRARELIEDKLVNGFGFSDEAARLRAPAIIAKIETNRGWQNRHHIIDVADGVMVARGDLGLQVEIQRVPDIQKRLIVLCNKRGKPVITATQMLTSMTASTEPTRAEVSDVFNAIQDGTDAVMLSEETAVGRFPFHALRKMVEIAIRAESYYELEGIPKQELRGELRRERIVDFLKDGGLRIERARKRMRSAMEYVSRGWGLLAGDKEKQRERLEWRRGVYLQQRRLAGLQEMTNRITEATCTMAEATAVSAIVAATSSGHTVRMLSRFRPRVTIVGAAQDVMNARKLVLSYGVVPLLITDPGAGADGGDDLFAACREVILRHDYLKRCLEGQTIIFTGSFPLRRPGTTNMLQIRRV